ncbi:hypothetical protein V4F39_13050 [Aquincola sp. MAHUQ-54]|uniref:Uncharacterized protein n=1 Tax=Aquincola agrisoli TaxID=3119538 RepID=A0AAW9QEM9_9BURK
MTALPWMWLTGAAAALAGTVLVQHRRREEARARRRSTAAPAARQAPQGEGAAAQGATPLRQHGVQPGGSGASG